MKPFRLRAKLALVVALLLLGLVTGVARADEMPNFVPEDPLPPAISF